MGFNMSWMFTDGIDQLALFAALDLAPTGELPLEASYDARQRAPMRRALPDCLQNRGALRA